MSSSWINTQNANRFRNIYLQGFLDISGGNVLLRNGGLTVNGNTVINNSLSANIITVNTVGPSMFGNVFSHPLAVSVINSNNSGLFMGYDISNNAGYINSRNQSGFTNLCLQPQGGFLGIGNSTPRFTLDISGTLNISGNTFINGNINANSIVIGNSVISSGQVTNISGFTGSGLILNSTDNMVLNTRNTMILNTIGNISLQPSGNKIGIGKLNPQSILDISGNVNINNSSGPSLIISGNNLQIYGSGLGINLDSSSNRTIPSSQILAVDISSNTSDIIFKTAPYSLSGFNSNIERMRISNNGAIGIGTNQPAAGYELDIFGVDGSGVLRINQSIGSGGPSATTTGTILLQHLNSGGASSVLFNCPSLNSNYGSLTYYDNLNSSALFPNYTGTSLSALVIDTGGSVNQTNMVIRTNGQLIVDTGSRNTYFISGVSIGKSSVTAGYALDVVGTINSNNINTNTITSGLITVNSGGISVISGNVFSGSVNNFSVPSGNLFSGSVNSINGFAVYSPWIYGNIVTCGNLTASNLTISAISTSTLRLSGTANNNTIPGNYQQNGIIDTNSGAMIVTGGVSIGGSIGIGGTIYGNINSNSIQSQGIIIGNPGTSNGPTVTLQTPAINMFSNGSIIGNAGTSITGFSSYIGATGGIFQMDALRIGNFSGVGLIVNSGFDVSINSVLNAANINISRQCLFTQGSIVTIQNPIDVAGTQGALNVSGGVYVARSTIIGGSLTVGQQTTLNGPLSIPNSSSTVSIASQVRINSTSDSTGLNSGALQVAGGVGIGGNLHVGGNLIITNPSCNVTSATGTFTNLSVNTTVSTTNIVATNYFQGSINTPLVASQWTTGTGNIFYSGGNVGIGRTNPSFRLDVSGIINSSGYNVNGSPFITSQWTTTGSNIFYNTGSVGIGVTNPQSLLEIQGPIAVGTNSQMNITSSAGANTTTNTSTLNLRVQGAGGGMVDNTIVGRYFAVDSGAYGFSINPLGTNVMNIISNGRVGIGNSVTNPQATLQLTSTGQNAVTFQVSDLSNTNTIRLIGNLGALGFNHISQSNDVGIIYGSGSGLPHSLVIAPWATSSSGIRMNQNGAVGIGVSTPTTALDVNGSTLFRNPTVYNTTTAGWYNIGYWDCTNAQNSGAKLKLRIIGQNGYNGGVVNGTQAGGETTIYLCNLNNLNSGGGTLTTTVNLDGWWKHEGGNVPLSSIKVVQNGTNRFQYSIFAFVLGFTQHCINAETTFGTVWTTSFISTSDPGANSSTVQLITNSYNAIGTNFGIGTTTPQAQLDVSNEIAIKSTISTVSYSQTSTLGFGYGGGAAAGTKYRWKIDDITLNRDNGSGPNFDYGVQSKLIFSCKSNNTYAGVTNDNAYFQGLTLVPNSGGSGALSTSINVGIGTTSPLYPLQVNGLCVATSFNATSDYRLKKNVQLLDNKTIDLLRPVEYDLSGGKHDMGFLAHEVQEIFPFLVEGEKDGKDMQTLNYNGFIALLVKEVQNLKKENILLREKNDSFESRLQIMESLLLPK